MALKELSAQAQEAILAEQQRAFSPELAFLTGESDTAFFPGCSMMAHDAALVMRVWRYLATIYPGLALCTCCCGGHSAYVGLDKYFERSSQIRQMLDKGGVKRLIVCCPNCRRLFSHFKGLEVITVWQVLDEHPPRFQSVPADIPRYFLHDPCPARQDTASQDQVRRLLQRAGFPYEEMTLSRQKTVCCGRKHMLHLRDPQTAEKLRQLSLSQLKGRYLICWCFSCCASFSQAGCRCLHPLEIAFPDPRHPFEPFCRSEEEGWRQRQLLSLLAGDLSDGAQL